MQHPSEKISPSSIYYCPMECEGDKVYFQPGKRCPVCNMFLVPIEEKEGAKPAAAFSMEKPPASFAHKAGEFFCPMFCEGEKTYPDDTGCPVCYMKLEQITPELAETASKSQPVAKISGSPGQYYCPMFCEGDKTYPTNVGCPVCGMDLVQIPGSKTAPEEDSSVILRRKLRGALLFCVPLFLISMGGMVIKLPFTPKVLGWVELLLTLPILFYYGWFIIERGALSFRRRNLNMFSLIFVGTAAAFIYSVVNLIFPDLLNFHASQGNHHPALYFETVGVIITLVVFGQYLEARAHHRTSAAIRELMALSADTAQRWDGTKYQTISVEEIQPGDPLLVKTGEKIPADGTVIQGQCEIDEAMLTGEAAGVLKNQGDTVLSGTVILDGKIEFRAEKTGAETVLQQMISMVNTAAASKAPVQKLADRLSKYFVPVVLGVSVLTFLIWTFSGTDQASLLAISNALAVLIIACPCALGLATPVSMAVAIGQAAKKGILIKEGGALETLAKAQVLFLDKTGTLTKGKPELINIQMLDQTMAEHEALAIAHTLSSGVAHPLSEALSRAADKQNIRAKTDLTDINNIIGGGFTAHLGNRVVHFGSEQMMKSHQITTVQLDREGLYSVSWLAIDHKVTAAFFFKDELREGIQETIQRLKDEGLSLILASGDRPDTVAAIASELGIQEYYAEQSPRNKMELIQKLQGEGRVVAFAGDGINDAPALAQADIGIAMGDGTAAAIESAPITLLRGNLSRVLDARLLGRRTMKNIRQNLFFAFFYNAVGIPLAAGLLYPATGWLLTPMIAAVAMSFSSFSVIINALRLYK